MAYPELTLHHTHRDTLVRCTTTRATLPALLLRAYLPAYPAHLTRRHQLDLSATYIPASPLTTHDLLRSSQVIRACHSLIDALALAATSSSSSSPSLLDAADAHLADALARAQLEDRRAGAPSPRGVRNQRTLATFLVFADVSRAFRSRRLGGVLARFFARHGARMLAGDDDRRYYGDDGFLDEYGGGGGGPGEHPHAVVLWAWALAVLVRTGEAEREACLKEVLRCRPDVLGAGSRFEGFAKRGLPGGEAFWDVLERVGGEREGWGLGPGSGWRRRVLEDGGVEYLHEHRERRVVRAGGAGSGSGVGRPLGVEVHHRSRRILEPEEMITWKPALRGYSGIRGGDVGVRGALESIKDEQRELRHDVHDLKDELDEITERIEKLGRRDRERRRRDRLDWRERDVLDLSEDYESESISEWFDEYY